MTVTPYRSTPVFDELTLPQALRHDHSTKAGVWGRIRVISGRLLYMVTDPRRRTCSRDLTPEAPSAVIEPTIVHRVVPIGEVQFQVEFWR